MRERVFIKDAEVPSDPVPQPSDNVSLQWAVVGLVLPAMTYLVTYSIRLGEARHYGVPEGLVSVSLHDVMCMVFPIIGTFVMLAFVLKGLIGNIKLPPVLRRLVGPILFITVYAIVTWWSIGPGRRVWVLLGLAGLMALLLVADLALKIRKHGSLRTALDVMEATQDNDPDMWSLELWTKILRAGLLFRPVAIILLLLVGLYFLLLGEAIGRGIARQRTEYLVAASRPQQVVLLINDSRAVLGRLRKNDIHVLDDDYEVVELADLGSLSRRELGRLRGQR